MGGGDADTRVVCSKCIPMFKVISTCIICAKQTNGNKFSQSLKPLVKHFHINFSRYTLFARVKLS